MRPKSFMLIAGEPSGDQLAAELVRMLREEISNAQAVPTYDYQPLYTSLEPRFFGAGGPHMASAGVELALDLTAWSTIGFSDVAKHYFKFRRILQELYRLAVEREPDAIICVDYGGFNRRFARAIQRRVRARVDWFHDWDPKLIQYVSPQVWASRPGRAYQIAKDFDLLLSIIPFEKAWYKKRLLRFAIEFVGHPIVDRYVQQGLPSAAPLISSASPMVLLLPGSRPAELSRHLPVMLEALGRLRREIPGLRSCLVLPTEGLVQQAERGNLPPELRIQAGGLAEALAAADAAIASTGTVTLECARFGVPTVAIYKTSWATFQIARHLVKVKYLAMPNLLADQELFPEFVQDNATAENIAGAILKLLRDPRRNAIVKSKLTEVIGMLGPSGASRRAAQAILHLVQPELSAQEPTKPSLVQSLG